MRTNQSVIKMAQNKEKIDREKSIFDTAMETATLLEDEDDINMDIGQEDEEMEQQPIEIGKRDFSFLEIFC